MLIEPATGARITFMLGITNIIGLFLVFFSCRCLMGSSLQKRLWQHDWYKKFYNAHCHYWKLFFISVLIHAVFAIIYFGIPS